METWSVLLILASIPFTWEIGEELTCPEVFTDGINIITCKINQTAIDNAGCLSVQKSVTFDLTVDNTTSSTCLAAYNSLDNCPGKQNEEQCWCDHKDGNIFVYKFSFHFNRTIHKGGQMECKLCIPPPSSNHLASTATGSCKKLKDTDSAKTPRLFPNGVTAVVEGRQVHLSCESDGRPTPKVTISNNDNNTVIKTDSSPVNHTFIARCEDMATYTCIAWNKFSRHVTTSLSLKLEVGCKPRSQVTTDIGKITFPNSSEELDFNVIASPVPRDYVVWFVGVTPNITDDFPERVDGSSMNVTCQAYTDRRYLAKCKLTVFSVYYGSGYYRVQVINEHGDENFTVEIIYNPAKLTKSGQKVVAALAGAGAGLAFIITIT